MTESVYYPFKLTKAYPSLDKLAAASVSQFWRARVVDGVWTEEFLLTASSTLPFRNASTVGFTVEVEYIDRWIYGGTEVVKESRQSRFVYLQPVPADTGTVDFSVSPSTLYASYWGTNVYNPDTGNYDIYDPANSQYFNLTFLGFTFSGTPIPAVSDASQVKMVLSGTFSTGGPVYQILLEDGTPLLLESSSQVFSRPVLTEDSPKLIGGSGIIDPINILNPAASYTSPYIYLPLRSLSTDPEPSVAYDLTLDLRLDISPGLGYQTVVTKSITIPGFWPAVADTYW